MSRIPTAATENGRRSKTLRTALVIDTHVQDHLTTRRALRETQIFELILSATDDEIARDLLNAPETPEPLLILLSEALAEEVLAHMPERLRARTVLLHGAGTVQPDQASPGLRKPVTASAIKDILSDLT